MIKIEHVAMYVENIEAAKDFFVKYFEGTANEMYRNEKNQFCSYFITFADGARLEIMNMVGVEEKAKSVDYLGFIHLAFSLGSKEKVLELTETLRKDGYEVNSEPRTTGDGYFESAIMDLEGNKIELTV